MVKEAREGEPRGLTCGWRSAVCSALETVYSKSIRLLTRGERELRLRSVYFETLDNKCVTLVQLTAITQVPVELQRRHNLCYFSRAPRPALSASLTGYD